MDYNMENNTEFKENEKKTYHFISFSPINVMNANKNKKKYQK